MPSKSFMIEEVLPGLFRLEVPLPRNPLKSINSYVVRGEDRHLIIDTGMNIKECLTTIVEALKILKIDLSKTDFFITHLHADHIGLVGKLASENSKIYLSDVEIPIVKSVLENSEDYWSSILKFFEMNGFPKSEAEKALREHPAKKYYASDRVELTPISDGDTIEIGNYTFIALLTPGHSPGHMCLYEQDKKILFSGDHILFDITPNITWWREMENPLKTYLESLERVYSLEVNLVLPGHRSIWKDHRKRIDELKIHHRNRLNEIIQALKDGEKTAWDIASQISWDIDFKTWDDFPITQKWFAVGETIAHLIYLERFGKVKKVEKNGKILYSIN